MNGEIYRGEYLLGKRHGCVYCIGGSNPPHPSRENTGCALQPLSSAHKRFPCFMCAVRSAFGQMQSQAGRRL